MSGVAHPGASDPQTRPVALTAPQLRALTILGSPTSGEFVTPKQLAKRMWPDSKGWQQRSRRHATAAGGALGATMPMKGATMLWKLHTLGLADLTGTAEWRITDRGRRVLAEASRPAPPFAVGDTVSRRRDPNLVGAVVELTWRDADQVCPIAGWYVTTSWGSSYASHELALAAANDGGAR